MSKKKILVGGQAVIEGVMMRVPGAYATAVRKPDGEIETQRAEFVSLTDRVPFLKAAIFRGVIALYESLKIGLNTLQLSAEIAIREEEKTTGAAKKKEGKFSLAISMIIALIVGFGLFFALPLFLTTVIFDIERKALAFNLVSGMWRIAFFLIYLWIISLMKDVKRLFQYHGAEHRVVFTFESGKELNVDNTRDFTTYHPRCGTSFIFIVLIVSILMFSLIDTVVIFFAGRISLGLRFAVHIPLMPLVAGVGYEFLKLTSKHLNSMITRWFSKPGLWLQHITTKPPSDDQLEVAIVALKTAFGEKFSEYEGKKYVADAID